MKRLDEEIKTGQLQQVYLLYGEEGYLKKQYKDRIIHALVPEEDSINLSVYDGKDVSLPAVVDKAEELPFFAENRLIVLEDTGWFKGAVGAEFAEELRTMPDSTYVLFVEDEVDKRSKLFKVVQDKGRAVELPYQDEETLKQWVAVRLKRENKRVKEQTVLYFLEHVGMDMETISSELDKVCSYAMDRDVVTKEDIDAVCATKITDQIFDMVDAVAESNQEKALQLYSDLLALKEPPMRILSLLTRQYRILYQVKPLSKQRIDRKEIASKIGVPPFSVPKVIRQADRFQPDELQAILEKIADLEKDVKTGMIQDSLAVELFIVDEVRGKTAKTTANQR